MTRLKYTGRWQRDGGSDKNKIRAAVIGGGNDDNDGSTAKLQVRV